MQTFRTKLSQVETALHDASVYCGHGYESVSDEAVALVLAAAGLPPEQPLSLLDQPFPVAAERPLMALLDRRCRQRLPVAYCLKESYLAGLRFIADPRALIPRSPVAHIVAERLAPWWPEDQEPRVIVDVCCGGGSLGLVAAEAFPRARVLLSDLDGQALSLASENIALHERADRICAMRADLLNALSSGSVDVVLANPPYVSRAEMAELPPEYNAEPRIALEADAEGTELAVRLLREGARVLAPDGLMLLEVGETWMTLEDRLPKVPFLWLELPQGGSGVAVISAEELRDWDAAGIL
jgi:ribosomal protein L3 glutamine methyltransferase